MESKKTKQTNNTKQKQTHRYKLVVARREGVGGMGKGD